MSSGTTPTKLTPLGASIALWVQAMRLAPYLQTPYRQAPYRHPLSSGGFIPCSCVVEHGEKYFCLQPPSSYCSLSFSSCQQPPRLESCHQRRRWLTCRTCYRRRGLRHKTRLCTPLTLSSRLAYCLKKKIVLLTSSSSKHENQPLNLGNTLSPK